MADWHGRFDSKGAPTLKIDLSLGSVEYKNLEALLDTGFSGFLLFPVSNLKKLPSMEEEFQVLTLANGSKIIRLQTSATVTVEQRNIPGIAILELEGKEIILGMKFLRSAKRGLHVFPERNEVILLEALSDTP